MQFACNLSFACYGDVAACMRTADFLSYNWWTSWKSQAQFTYILLSVSVQSTVEIKSNKSTCEKLFKQLFIFQI